MKKEGRLEEDLLEMKKYINGKFIGKIQIQTPDISEETFAGRQS